jgi:transporter family-2 protein
MFFFLSLLMGVFISIMIAVNGWLSVDVGLYTATVLIHIVGLVLICAVVLIMRVRPFAARHKWYLYMGGAIGVATTVFNNLAFGRISISAILGLVLLGQSVASIAVDQWGLFGMPQHRVNKWKLPGIAIIIAGIATMVADFDTLAVVVSLLAGFCVVLSRTFNAKLSQRSNVYTGTFFNYVVGLAVAIPVFFLLGRNEMIFTNFNEFALSPRWYIYMGGVLGVVVVLASNVIVVKVSAFYFTLLTFVGQIAASITLDIFIAGEAVPRNVIGGALVAVGLVTDLFISHRTATPSTGGPSS